MKLEHFICSHDPKHPDQLTCREDPSGASRPLFTLSKFHKFFDARFARHYHPSRKHARLHLLVDALLGASVIALLFFAIIGLGRALDFFSPLSVAAEKDIQLFSAVPNTVSVTVSSRSQGIDGMTIHIVAPRDVDVMRIDGKPYDFHAPLALDGLAPGQQRAIPLTLRPLGKMGSSGELRALVRGIDKDGRTVAKDIAIPFSVSRTPVELSIEIPNSAVAGQAVAADIFAINQTMEVIPSIRLEVQGSDGKKIETRALSDIQPGERTKISVTLPPGDAPKSGIRVAAFLSYKGFDFPLGTKERNIAVAAPELQVQISTAVKTATPGESVPLTLALSASRPLAHVRTHLRVEGPFKTNAPLVSGDGRLVSEQEMMWQFDTLSDSHRRTATVRIPRDIENPSESDSSDVYEIRITPRGSYDDGTGQRIEVTGQVIRIPLSSPIELSASARYFSPEGEQLGRGPLPPRIGSATRYLVFISPRGNFHPVNEVSGAAQLGDNVAWTGKVLSGAEYLSYDEKKKVVSWNFGSLPPYNTQNGTVGAIFELSLTPNAEDFGTEPILLRTPSLSAVDAVTGKKNEYAHQTLTTRLTNDTQAAEKSRVVR